MRIIWDGGTPRRFWLTPAVVGALFILLGILIFEVPNLLEYIVAGLFLFIGLVLVAVAWQTRVRVSYRPLDEE